MGIYHAIIGVIEGFVTVSAIYLITTARPDLVDTSVKYTGRSVSIMMDNKTFIIVGIVIALLIGVVAVFMASGDPDGLESTALVVQGRKPHREYTGRCRDRRRHEREIFFSAAHARLLAG